MEIKGQELADYIFGLDARIRDMVEVELTEALLLNEALSTQEGQRILKSSFDLIEKNVREIINLCVDGDRGVRLIADKAKEISVTYSIISQWGKILKTGFDHIDKAKK